MAEALKRTKRAPYSLHIFYASFSLPPPRHPAPYFIKLSWF